jgi:hypothetical protein
MSGPFKLNGVPLRRVNQAYTIATSTKVDVSAVDVSKFDDAFFTKSANAEKKSGDFLGAKTKVLTMPIASDFFFFIHHFYFVQSPVSTRIAHSNFVY